MASGHRKRKASLVRLEVLNPVGLTNASPEDRGVLVNQNNLVNLAIYSAGGFSPTFRQGSTNLLTDAVSNADGLWSLAGLTGEITNTRTSDNNPNGAPFTTGSMSSSVGLFTNSKHYMFPSPLSGTLNISSSAVAVPGPYIFYSYDGPQANYAPLYISGTTLVLLPSSVTGAGSPTHISIYVGGQIQPTDRLTFANGVGTTLSGRTSAENFASVITNGITASGTDLSSANYRKAFIVSTSSVANGMAIYFVQQPSPFPVTNYKGFFIAIGSGSYP